MIDTNVHIKWVERGTVFIQQSDCLGIEAIGHSGGSGLKGPLTRMQQVEQAVCWVEPVSYDVVCPLQAASGVYSGQYSRNLRESIINDYRLIRM